MVQDTRQLAVNAGRTGLEFPDVSARSRLETRGGISLRRVRLPATGTATLRFTSPGRLD